MIFLRQSAGLVGSLFVSTCCLGGGPILAALATSLGFSAFHSILNIYVLGPLMTASILWIILNIYNQGQKLIGNAWTYIPFWSGVIGGALAWLGIILPYLVVNMHIFKTVLIIIGMALLFASSIWNLIDQHHQF